VASSIGEIVATLQLKGVQDVLGAIHNADAATAKRLASQAFAHEYDRPRDCYCESASCAQTTHLPGKVIRALPTYVPGKVVHLPVKYVHRLVIEDPKPAKAPELTAAPPPPWKLPLPVEPAGCAIVIKRAAPRPDVISKGMLIDLFV
jgi:hypothetical protein